MTALAGREKRRSWLAMPSRAGRSTPPSPPSQPLDLPPYALLIAIERLNDLGHGGRPRASTKTQQRFTRDTRSRPASTHSIGEKRPSRPHTTPATPATPFFPPASSPTSRDSTPALLFSPPTPNAIQTSCSPLSRGASRSLPNLLPSSASPAMSVGGQLHSSQAFSRPPPATAELEEVGVEVRADRQAPRRTSVSRDLFAGGEREAVRCRPSSLCIPDDLLAGPPEDLAMGPLDESRYGYRTDSRRGSLQHPPPIPAIPHAYAQPRRHSEQPRSAFLPSPATFALRAHPQPPQIPSSPFELRPSPSPRRSSFTPPSAPRAPHAGDRQRSRTLSALFCSASPGPVASAPSRIRRKPVPALAIEDDVDTVTDPRWDGTTPSSIVSSADSSYGFPHTAAVSPTSGATSVSALSDIGGISSIEEKVRRLSLEAGQTGATGLGLGLMPAASVRRKTLADLKAEKLAQRRASAGQVEAKREEVTDETLARRRATEGSLQIDSLKLPSDHLAAESELASPTYCSLDSASSAPPSTLSTPSSSIAPSSAPSSKRPFRPFALLRQSRTRSLTAHEVILPRLAAAAPARAKAKDEEDLVDAWMQIIVGKDDSEMLADEEAAPAFVFGSHSKPNTALDRPASPRTPLASLATPFAALDQFPSQPVYGTENGASLASSLPPLVYAAAPAVFPHAAAEESGQAMQDAPPVSGSAASEGNDECGEASSGPASREARMKDKDDMSIFLSASFAPVPSCEVSLPRSTDLVNLSMPKRLNKRSASASYVDRTPPPPCAFASQPRSPRSALEHFAAPTPLALDHPVPLPLPSKRPHLSSPSSPPAFSAPRAVMPPPRTDKPLPPRPPRPPKSSRRSINLSGTSRRTRVVVPEGELEGCPVLLGRVVSTSTSSESGESSVEAIKLVDGDQHRPAVAVVL